MAAHYLKKFPQGNILKRPNRSLDMDTFVAVFVQYGRADFVAEPAGVFEADLLPAAIYQKVRVPMHGTAGYGLLVFDDRIHCQESRGKDNRKNHRPEQKSFEALGLLLFQQGYNQEDNENDSAAK